MLTIRFSRIGKRKHPFYRIIISEKHKDTQGRYLELLGHYNPFTKEAIFKKERIHHWVGVGADISDSVFNLLVKHQVIESLQKRHVVHISEKRRAKLSQKEQPQAEQKPVEASNETAPAESEKGAQPQETKEA